MRQVAPRGTKFWTRRLAIAALAVLALFLGMTTTGLLAAGDEPPPIPEKRELKYPNLGSSLNDLVVLVAEGAASAQEAADGAGMQRGRSIAVTVYLSGNVDNVVGFLENNGGDPRNVGEDYIEAYVPVTLLAKLSEQPGVLRVREIIPPQTDQAGPITGHGPPVHGSQAWNRAGWSGQGIKVGVIDSFFAFNGFRALMGTELPSTVQARCYTDVGSFTINPADCESTQFGSDHGTKVAESVMDIAPEVELYIASPISRGDAVAVVDWMVAEGVSVIARSETYLFDGPGDGTSPYSNSPLNTVDRAVTGGITWVNSAGNYAQRTWFGGYANADRDRWIEFNLSYETISLQLEAGDKVRVQLRWQGTWGGAGSDFDLFLWDLVAGTVLASSRNPQSGNPGDVPFEFLDFMAPRDGEYHVAVGHYSGSIPGWLQLMVRGLDVRSIQHYTGNGSIANPSESANPGMLAVGAAPWYDVDTIEDYSSRGPTPDGRVKPDIVGAACGATALAALNVYNRGFCGTSQAAPHVAGLAALVQQRFPNYTPAQVASYLKDNAVQRETPDPNNTWGHGFALLPTPSGGCAAYAAGLESDCNTLLGLRDSLSGSASLNWSPNTWIAEWEGVTVAGSPPRVTELILPGKGVSGQLPAGLGDLTNLTVLSLASNKLTGEIPSQLGNLANLTVLSLAGNELTGEIPSQLGNLANLRELYLHRNQLTGSIPTSLGSLTTLEELYLSDNQLTGKIPVELGDLANLEVLRLWGNQLTGEIPIELGSLANLTVLSLSENQLTGGIPTELGGLANLEELVLWGNQLSGEIPIELGSIANLTVLRLSHNQLTGGIPSQLGSLTTLEGLYLSDNHLTGSVPTWLGNLTTLEELSLSDNQLTGGIPTELGRLANLRVLYLDNNQLTGAVPTWLGSLPNLTILALSNNQLTGGIRTELGRLANLRVLYLHNNQLTGGIPTELGRLANLRVLYLHNNQLTGEIPSQLGSLTTLEGLSLSDNQLTGGIPTELGRLANLRVLYLHNDQLTGAVPTWLGSLSNLTILALSNNQLTGSIPTSLGNLSNLRELYLSDNRLTGGVPAELGGLSKLELLRLWGNQLSGEIPIELGSLANLAELYLYRNQLTGSIPTSLGSLSNLTVLRLSNNQLTGKIPTQLGGLTNLTVLSLAGNELTGEIPSQLGNLANLRQLYLHHNHLTGPVPTWLGSLSNLTVLRLSDNQLTGGIPTELGRLDDLLGLWLEGNQLTGAVPTWLGSLSNLTELVLSYNQLTGGIPTELGGLADLTVLILSHNQLTGGIPTELGGLSKLEVLRLWGNQLSGEIPSQLGNLTNLRQLYLHHNQLTGAVPTWLGSLSNLTVLRLSDNQLTGGIPTELGRLDDLRVLYLEGNQLTGCVPIGLRRVTNNDFSELGLPFCFVPEFPAAQTGERTVAENTGASMPIGDPVMATAPDSATLTYSLGGTDAAAFAIVPETGQIMTKAALDYETKDSYEVTVTATHPSGGIDTLSVTIMVIDVDEAPVLTGSTTIRYIQDGTDPVATFTATDPEGANLTWSLSGDDEDDFTITGGVLAFTTSPDYEAPADADTDNEYQVTVEVSDGTNNASIDVSVTVTEDAPQTLLERYDADDSGSIERSEVIAAINEYFDGGANAPTRKDVIAVINLYFDS